MSVQQWQRCRLGAKVHRKLMPTSALLGGFRGSKRVQGSVEKDGVTVDEGAQMDS